jgi:hypothetical protein
LAFRLLAGRSACLASAGRFTARPGDFKIIKEIFILFAVGSEAVLAADPSFKEEGEGGGDGVLLRLLRGEVEPSDIVRGLVVGKGDNIA